MILPIQKSCDDPKHFEMSWRSLQQIEEASKLHLARQQVTSFESTAANLGELALL